jgi:hypothetical protein
MGRGDGDRMLVTRLKSDVLGSGKGLTYVRQQIAASAAYLAQASYFPKLRVVSHNFTSSKEAIQVRKVVSYGV